MSNYEDKNVDDLQDELRERDLPVSGNKPELIERLEEDDKSKEGDDQNAPADEDSDSTDETAAAPDEAAAASDENDTPDDPDEDDDPAEPAEATESGESGSGPTAEQVVKEDGWVVQRGSWRKGPGEDTNDNED